MDGLSQPMIQDAATAIAEPPFRGTMVDNCAMAPMGKGHGNGGRPFDIETACYLKPIVAAYNRSTVRKIVIKAGVKTMKSFFVEMAAADHVCHGQGDSGIFFGTAEAADDVSSTRILSFFDGIKSYQEKKKTILGQYDMTMSAVKFPDKTFWLKPANLANSQQKNLEMFGVQDAFVCGASGMIDQLIERTTQYPDTKKIIIESQGGEKGFDSDRHYDDTDQGELCVLCPICGMSHVFNWKAMDEQWMTRVEGFKAVPPIGTPEVEREEWVKANTPLMIGKVAGFQRGPDEKIKKSDGSYNEAAILRETHFLCFHCNGRWDDDGEFGPTRIALDRSSHYVSARKDALPENIGFNIAQWINRRLPWGSIMLQKLKRQKVAHELGNYEPLKQFWQKMAGRTWDSDISAKAPEKIGATIYDLDPKLKHPGESGRISGTDIQLNLTHMIYEAWAIGDGMRPKLLHYEWIKPPVAGWSDEMAREFCKSRVRELNKEFGIEVVNCMMDARHRPDLMREWAAEDAILVDWRDPSGRMAKKWFTYGLLMGDDKLSYKWSHPGRAATFERYKQYDWTWVDTVKDGRKVRVPVHHRLWSNGSLKDIATRWRDGDSAPKIEVHEKFLQHVGDPKESFEAQMNSERKVPWKNRPGKFIYDNEGRPNHAWDAFLLVVERMDELGMLNHFGAPEADDQP